MKVVAVDFVRSAAGPDDFPRERWPQVALVGRSNVGKSSLLNALTRRSVARTSAKPGKTRLLNVYRLRAEGWPAPNLFLVDLPGYGYARGGAGARQTFDALVEAYYAHPPAPTTVAPGPDHPPGPYGPTASVLLVDARHPGLDADSAAVGWLQASGRPFVVAAAKIDKLTRAERQRAEREFADALHVPIVPVSATTGEGLNELWTEIKQRLSGPSA